jgi:hypothetical protein
MDLIAQRGLPIRAQAAASTEAPSNQASETPLTDKKGTKK